MGWSTLAPRRPVAVLAVALTLLTATAPVATADVDPSAEAGFVALIADERAARGLPPLTVRADLVAVARTHSGRMASQEHLHHNPDLGTEVGGWQRVGENVGKGPSVTGLHGAFMASDGHRRNILDERWSEIGVGVEVVDGRIWVTVIFRLPFTSSAPAPAPTPTEEAAPAPAPASEAPTASAPAPSPSATPHTHPPVDPAPEPTEPPPPPTLDRTLVTIARVDAAEDGGADVADLLDG